MQVSPYGSFIRSAEVTADVRAVAAAAAAAAAASCLGLDGLSRAWFTPPPEQTHRGCSPPARSQHMKQNKETPFVLTASSVPSYYIFICVTQNYHLIFPFTIAAPKVIC